MVKKQVRLKGKTSGLTVNFDITPDVSEAAHANYAEIADIRIPGSILIYSGSPSRTFSLSGKLYARTSAEADVMYSLQNILRSWRMPKKNNLRGNSANTNSDGSAFTVNTKNPSDVYKVSTDEETKKQRTTISGGELFGNDSDTPEVIKLYGYGTQFKGIPTVMTNLNFNFSSDVDYIVTTNLKTWVPIIQDVTIELKEAREVDGGPGSIQSFDIIKFRKGVLDNW